MTTHTEKPIAIDVYEAIAENYATTVDSKAIYVHYERPALLSLLPEVNGKRVLDAGCGPGSYAEWFVRHGAKVIALDISSKMVQLARKRLGGTAEVRQADLTNPLDFLEDESIDIIWCPLVLHYIKEWDSVFTEFSRILGQSGLLIFSIHHPLMDFIKFDAENYFATELVEDTWTGFGELVKMPFYRRPLSAIIAPLLSAGFLIEQMIEPQPTAAYQQEDPAEYELLCREPRRLCIRAKKSKVIAEQI